MRRAEEAAQKVESLCDAILAEAAELPSEILIWRPAPEVWSVMDVLCHIEEFIPFWTAQVLQVIQHPDRKWGRDHMDAVRRAAVENTAARNLVDVEKNIRDSASRAVASLRGLSETDLDVEAPSVNPRWGTKPASFIVEELLVVHLEKHLGQIRRNEVQFSNFMTT